MRTNVNPRARIPNPMRADDAEYRRKFVFTHNWLTHQLDQNELRWVYPLHLPPGRDGVKP